ncbi:MAG: Fic family protein, partial [Egibacteraceae bacterium]
MLHYQFETIHPFLDGNGRLGRLLIILFLVEQDVLPQPLLCMSSYFETRKGEYYDRLQAVRERGELAEWMQFFLHGVAVQATDAVDRAERLADLRQLYREKLQGSRSRAGEVVDLLFENPVATAKFVAERLGDWCRTGVWGGLLAGVGGIGGVGGWSRRCYPADNR